MSPNAAQPDPQGARSPGRRALFWCLIGVVYVVVAFEWRAHRGYVEAADWLGKALANPPRGGEPLTREDVLKQLGPSDNPADDKAPTPPDLLEWTWRSTFQRYHVRVPVEDDGSVKSFEAK